jgi:hypothetical protein
MNQKVESIRIEKAMRWKGFFCFIHGIQQLLVRLRSSSSKNPGIEYSKTGVVAYFYAEAIS